MTGEISDRRRIGLANYRDVTGEEPPRLLTPRSRALVDFVFGEVWARTVLDRRSQRLIAIASATTVGGAESAAALVHGSMVSGDLDVGQLGEVALHLAVYAGWTVAEGLDAVIAHQWRRISGDSGTDQLLSEHADNPHRSRVDRARDVFLDVNLTAAPNWVTGPFMDVGVMGFAFGELWQRPVLSRRDRRWIALASAGAAGIETPIRSNVASAIRSNDICREDLYEAVLLFAVYAGWPRATFVQQIVHEEDARIAAERGRG